jgi:hypothetical protein
LKHETDTGRNKTKKEKNHIDRQILQRSGADQEQTVRSTVGIGRNGLIEDRRALYFKHKSE